MHDTSPREQIQQPPQSETCFLYCDGSGQPLYEAVHSRGIFHFLGQDYTTRKISYRGPENFDLATSAIPYQLQELNKTVAAGQTIYIAADEEMADSIRNLGFPATCFVKGVCLPRYEAYFKNADVVLITRFYVEPAKRLAPITYKLRITPPPETINSKEEFARLVAAATVYAAQPEAFGLKLSPPKVLPTKRGDKRMVRSGPPTKAFEDAWRASSAGDDQ
jgi:hypothetical protein